MEAKEVRTNAELQQVLALQRLHLRGVNDAVSETEQGFLTVTHTLEMLQEMHRIAPGIIVTDGVLLAGYALSMTRDCKTLVPELFSLFTGLDALLYKGKPLADYRFYVMGQICVAPAYRGLGVFDLLYQKHRQVFRDRYNLVITEIATRNTRSMRAHERIGFTTLQVHTDELDEWAVVVWDWSQQNMNPWES